MEEHYLHQLPFDVPLEHSQAQPDIAPQAYMPNNAGKKWCHEAQCSAAQRRKRSATQGPTPNGMF
jgi:hypothetical protein